MQQTDNLMGLPKNNIALQSLPLYYENFPTQGRRNNFQGGGAWSLQSGRPGHYSRGGLVTTVEGPGYYSGNNSEHAIL